ncbi:Peroxisomal biogenesis factor 19 [Golovinomyces cichoracearum]|uniref:Peroxisomal biogenesis factor 19 n=1 Tax=Golovinomyces cichoracearum TaxID=62708 RepID=A0A420J6U4_9PEZI|nr:Peroxisomal biogenesis factor 19 [Golovinomyces cichoracearum]
MEKDLNPDIQPKVSDICAKKDTEPNTTELLVPGEDDPQSKNVFSESDGGDSYDDLDDMLDEFGPVKPESVAPFGPETHPKAVPDDDFEKQLQAEMAELFGDLGKSTDVSTKFEDILKELSEALPQKTESGKNPSSVTMEDKTKASLKLAKTEGEETFQDTIKKTMDRMAASGDQASAAVAALEDDDGILAEMLKAMQSSTNADGEGGEEDFSKALLEMMEQLTNKDILYEPMKELNDKFPDWMENHSKNVKKEDLERYKKQQIYVSEIVKRFESEKYNDDSVADKEYIVERMQKMQAAGSPPSELVGDLAAAQEALGAPEEGCPMQ